MVDVSLARLLHERADKGADAAQHLISSQVDDVLSQVQAWAYSVMSCLRILSRFGFSNFRCVSMMKIISFEPAANATDPCFRTEL